MLCYHRPVVYTPIQKALTFRASSIGDCLMGKYLLENIHAQYPQARLGIVVASRGAMIRDLCAAYPWLEILEVNRRSPKALFSLGKDFHGSDLVVTQYAGKVGGSFGLASKLAARMLAKRGGLVGFVDAAPRWNAALYDQMVPVHLERAVADRDRAALYAAGLAVPLSFPTLQCVQDNSMCSTLDIEAGKFIVVHLFAGNAGRGLHPDKKRELLSALGKKLPGTRLVVSGGAADREEALCIAKGTGATVIAGDVTLQQLMNLISESRGVVSVDTGVAHMAAQLRKPLVVMCTCLGANWWLPEQYGENAPITVFSRGDFCRLGHSYKKYPDCLNTIDMETIAQQTSLL